MSLSPAVHSWRAILIFMTVLCSVGAANMKFFGVRITVPDAQASWATGVTDDGRMVGSLQIEGAPTLRGWKFDGTQVSGYEVPGSSETVADDISNTGTVVGAFVESGVTLGFVEKAGNVSVLSAPAAIITYATGVNDQGQVVGHATTGDQSWAFLWDGTSYATLGIPDAVSYGANDINNHSQVVGAYWNDDDQLRGYLYEDGLVTTIHVPGAAHTIATGLNDYGHIVGTYFAEDGVATEFLYAKGRYNRLFARRAEHVAVLGINNRGRVVGRIGTLTETFAFYGDIKRLRHLSRPETQFLQSQAATSRRVPACKGAADLRSAIPAFPKGAALSTLCGG